MSHIQTEVQCCQVKSCCAGFSGNQVMGGLLLHTTRNTVTKACVKKFDKFVTSCTYNTTLYDDATGKVVVLPTTTGGLDPYGVDPVFLDGSDVEDSSLFVGEQQDCKDVSHNCKLWSCNQHSWQATGQLQAISCKLWTQVPMLQKIASSHLVFGWGGGMLYVGSAAASLNTMWQ